MVGIVHLGETQRAAWGKARCADRVGLVYWYVGEGSRQAESEVTTAVRSRVSLSFVFPRIWRRNG